MDKLARRGFSTLELMIALAIMTLVLSAVVIVSFGNQAFLIGGQTNAEAMKIAQELLESAQANARKDFNLVSPVASTTEDIFEKAVYVRLLPDFLTKEVRALVSWEDERKQKRFLELTTLVANFDTPVGGNTCDSALAGDWSAPQIEQTIDFSSLSGIPGGMYTLSDVDAYEGKLYVTASIVSGSTNPNFFIFNISNPASPVLLAAIDNEGTSGGTTSAGPTAVRVSQDPASSPVKTYAYIANGYTANYTTCNPITTRNCGQLNIIDVSAPTLSSWNPLMTNLMLASSSAPNVKGSQARGVSLYYKNGYLLLGLAATGAGNGPEFHLIDVHNPLSLFAGPHLLFPIGSYAVGNEVNAITMRGTYAYLATPNVQELHTLNLTNPNTPTLVGGFSSGTGLSNGKSMYLVGNNLYLGKTVPNTGNDFHILNNTTPGATLTELGGIDVPSTVNAVIVRDYLSFLLTNTELRLYRTDVPATPTLFSTLAIPQNGHASVEPSMDCEANRMYVTSNNTSGNGYLYVIKPGP